MSRLHAAAPRLCALLRRAAATCWGAAIGSGRRRGHWGGRDRGFDMHDFPANFEIPDLETDQIYYQQLLEAAMQYLPVLREAVVIQERRGLPTVTPDGLYLVSEVDQVQGLIVMSGCQVGGIWASPGLGRIVADVVSGQESLLPAAAFKVDRFADAYTHETPYALGVNRSMPVTT